MDGSHMWRRITAKLSSLLGITSSNSPSLLERQARMRQSLELIYSTAHESGYLVRITLIPYEVLDLTALSSTNTPNAAPPCGEPSSVLH